MYDKNTARQIIERLRLEPIEQEGGMYRVTWRAEAMVGEKNLGGAIYFMLTGKAFSHMHRLPTDELYHFYAGEPVELLLLHPDGRGERVVLGADVLSGQRPQVVAPAHCWQGSRLIGGEGFALMGTTMSPGFAPSDYEHGDAEALTAEYPQYAELIGKLTGSLIYEDC